MKQLEKKVSQGDFDLFAEVDQFAVEAVPRGAPLIFHDKRTAVEAEALIVAVELVELGDQGLDERGDGDGFFEAHGKIHDAELESGEVRMGTDIPPDFLGAIDAVGLDEEVDEVGVLAPAWEIVGDVGARELVEDFAAVALEAGFEAKPER